MVFTQGWEWWCKRWDVTPGHLSDDHSNVVERVRLTRKTRPGASSHVIPDPGHPVPRRWKRLRSSSSEGEGVRWADLAIFFLTLGLGEVCTGNAWDLPSEGTGVGFFPAGHSSRRDQCTGTGPFKFVASVCAYGQICAYYTPSTICHYWSPTSVDSSVMSCTLGSAIIDAISHTTACMLRTVSSTTHPTVSVLVLLLQETRRQKSSTVFAGSSFAGRGSATYFVIVPVASYQQ